MKLCTFTTTSIQPAYFLGEIYIRLGELATPGNLHLLLTVPELFNLDEDLWVYVPVKTNGLNFRVTRFTCDNNQICTVSNGINIQVNTLDIHQN